jgi:hypothetical protein
MAAAAATAAEATATAAAKRAAMAAAAAMSTCTALQTDQGDGQSRHTQRQFQSIALHQKYLRYWWTKSERLLRSTKTVRLVESTGSGASSDARCAPVAVVPSGGRVLQNCRSERVLRSSQTP